MTFKELNRTTTGKLVIYDNTKQKQKILARNPNLLYFSLFLKSLVDTLCLEFAI